MKLSKVDKVDWLLTGFTENLSRENFSKNKSQTKMKIRIQLIVISEMIRNRYPKEKLQKYLPYLKTEFH